MLTTEQLNNLRSTLNALSIRVSLDRHHILATRNSGATQEQHLSLNEVLERLWTAYDQIGAASDELQALIESTNPEPEPHPCDEYYAIRNTAAELEHEPEPHGSRDTFVPHPDGPDAERFNPLQD